MRGRRLAKRTATALAAAMTLAGSRRAFAYRPCIATDAAVADSGEVEVELGYAGFREDHGRVTIVAPAVVGNLGIARDVELVAESKLANDVTPQRGEDSTRFEDSAVSLKWVLREGVLQDHGARPSLAVELSALLPTLRGEDRPGGELVGILSGLTLGWTYHLNASALVEPGGSEPGVAWGVILEHSIRGALRAVAEVDGESVRASPVDDSALIGAIWSVPAPAPLHELSFDVGVRRGLSSAAADWGGTAGVTFAFPWRRTTSQENTP
jgi:hypothetical protein